MRCTNCGIESPPGKRFCGDCGAALANPCSKCGADNPAGKRFCGECGTALGAPAATASVKHFSDSPIRVAETPAGNLDGERKTVTLLFADIKGSMELIEDLDPEEARAIVDPALKLMIDAVHRYDGLVAQSMGDGIFALFGAPIAHEDHPQRALYAALRMQDESRRYANRLRVDGKSPISIRVGVNTGEVVVRSVRKDADHSDYVPVGHSTGLAQRMQALATPGSIAIAESTRKLVEGYFALNALGPTRVKGVSEPVDVYEVTGLGPLRTRLQRSATRGYTKFVGRQSEMSAMETAAERAKSGHGQVVAAMAEAGTGKSRLLFEFKAKNRSGWMVLETFSVSHGKASAYLPLIELLWNYFKINSEDDARSRREKVTGRVFALERKLEDTLPYLFSLLGIYDGDDPLAQMEGNVRKRRTLDAIKRIVLRESLNQPMMVVFEDLHWIDDETQALLDILVDSIPNSKILMLVNYRPEYSHHWGSKTYYTQLRLDPLGKDSADEMLTAMVGDGAEIRSLKNLIIQRTQGNPFFMEETVQVLLDEGSLAREGATARLMKPLGELKIPPTVQAILAARIDRLPASEKDLLQSLAIIGKEFPLTLVRAVTGKSDDDLNHMLGDLQLAEFIYEQPAVGDVEYTFKHALTQEVAYNSVLGERRRALHEQIAKAIETQAGDRLDDQLNEVAYHFNRAGNRARAIHYYRLAANQAAARSAFAQASNQASAALELYRGLPDSEQSPVAEWDLYLLLATSLRMFEGKFFEYETALRTMYEVATRIGDEQKIYQTLMMLFAHLFTTARFREAAEPLRQAFAIATRTESRVMLLETSTEFGILSLYAGDLTNARTHFERAIELTDAGPTSRTTTPHNFVGGATARGWLGRVMWQLGYPDQGRKYGLDAIALEAGSSEKRGVAFMELLAADVSIYRREPREVREHATRVKSLLTLEMQDPITRVWSTFLQGWAMVHEGPESEGLGLLRASFAELKGFLGIMAIPGMAAAQAFAYAGRGDEGLEAIAETRKVIDQSGEVFCNAELSRLTGELTLLRDSSDVADAEKNFRTAIEIAQQQRAKSWELRATTSLARLLNSQGKRDEARIILSEIYGWFTEGFDTADLKDAKVLVDELSA